MKTVPDEYPAHETLWRFAIIWTIVACIAAPLIIGYILKKPFDPNQILVSNSTLERIYARSDKEVMFGMKVAFCIALSFGFPCALAIGKLIAGARCYKNIAGIIVTTIISALTGVLFSLIPFFPLLMLIAALGNSSDDPSLLFFITLQISALNGFITAIIALPSRQHNAADEHLIDTDLTDMADTEIPAVDALPPSPFTFAEARLQAAAAIKELLYTQADLQGTPPPYLSRDYMEAESCWIFFRHERIHVSPASGPANSAIAVSKKGEVRLVADYRENPERAREYLQTISAHFIRHGGQGRT